MAEHIFYLSRMSHTSFGLLHSAMDLTMLLIVVFTPLSIKYLVRRMDAKTISILNGALAIMAIMSFALISAYLYFIRIVSGAFDLKIARKACVYDLKYFYQKQQDFYKINSRYAKSFEELQIHDTKYHKYNPSDYTYYLSDSSWTPSGLPPSQLHVKPRSDRIYAVCGQIPGLGYDEISIDYNGKIELLHSFDFWPLPRPE
jgi:hypothetical protein